MIFTNIYCSTQNLNAMTLTRGANELSPTTPIPLISPGTPSSAGSNVLPGFPIYSLGGDLHIFSLGGKYIFSFQLIVMTLTNISYSIVTIEEANPYMTFFLQFSITETTFLLCFMQGKI